MPLVIGQIIIVKLYLVEDAELIYNMAFNCLSIHRYIYIYIYVD